MRSLGLVWEGERLQEKLGMEEEFILRNGKSGA